MNCIYAYKIKLGYKYKGFGLDYKVYFRQEKFFINLTTGACSHWQKIYHANIFVLC